MNALTYDQIDWNSARGIAYADVRDNGGQTIFQGEDGFRRVRFVKGAPALEIMEGLTAEGSPGYWYETVVQDNTKITENNDAIGFRVYEPRDGE